MSTEHLRAQITSPETPRPTDRSMPSRAIVLAGPVAFAALFAIRAVRPAVDSTLVSILVALIVVVIGVCFRQRWAGAAIVIFPVALVTTPAAADLSFSLVADDSTWWRWHAVFSLLAAGWTAVAGIVVATGRRLVPGVALAAAGGGLLVGLGMIGLVQAIEPTEVFGEELSDAERSALPVIELLNFTYSPLDIPIDADGVHRALLVNPSTLPHTVTIDQLDLDVRVPAGRSAVIEIDGRRLEPGVVTYYCSIGDHFAQGMFGQLIIE